MSWFGGYKPPADREARRQKLEADRQQRAKEREATKKRLQEAASAREQEDQALRDLLNIEPDILADDELSIADSEVERLLAEESSNQSSLSEPIIMAEAFDVENGVDSEKAMDKIGGVKCPFEKDDIEYWFCELEGQLEVIGVKSQWLKRIALQQLLPVEIRQEVKSLLKLSKPNAGTDIYLRIKNELIELFGQKPEDAYLRAKNRVMSGKPSQLGKALIADLCKCDQKLNGCCCDRIVWGMFREALPVVVRNHIAELAFNKDTYKQVFKKADQVWDSNGASEPLKQVAAATASNEVAAVQTRKPSKNKNQNQGGQSGKNQKNQNGQSQNQTQNQSQNSGEQSKPKKPVISEEGLCRIHQKWKSDATFCAAPWGCKMKNIFKAPQ